VNPSVCLLFLLVSLSTTLHTATLSGIVTDGESGQPLPYVSVVLPELKRGDHTDLNGTYSIPKLLEGAWQVQVSSIGYLTRTDTLHIEQTLQHSVSLLPDPITMKSEIDLPMQSLKELVRGVRQRIHEDVFQPRYEELKTHRFGMRGTQTLYRGDSPKSGVRARIEFDGEGYYRNPGEIFQVITAYRSGNRLAGGFGMHPGAIVDIRKGSLGGKRFDVGPLPLSPNSDKNYRYRLVDTIQMGDIIVHRLSVMPKKKRKPGLEGYVWISGRDFSIVGYDLSLNRHTLQKLGIRELQTYQENALYFDKYWLPTNQTVRIRTIAGQLAEQTTTLSGYELNLTLADSLFAGPRLKMHAQATSRDTTYWKERSATLDADQAAEFRKLMQNDQLPEGWKRLMKE
jgi:hypothetical protein